MRRLILLMPLALLSLAACGGGSGGAGPDLASLTKTSGNITALNEQSSDVDGVEVECTATGRRSRSDDTGRFDLGDLPADIVDIEVRTPSGADVIVIPVDLRGGGSAVIRLAVNDDGVVRMSIERCHDADDQENETRARLMPIEDGLKGKVEIEKDDDGDQEFEVEVEHLAPGRTIEVFVVNADGVEESQGTATADVEGEAELELETEDGDVLPHGVADVAELEGFGVIVRDATSGDDLLRGEVPALGRIPPPCGDHDDDDDDDDDGDDDAHHEGRVRLTNAAGITGEAKARLRSRADANEERFKVEVERTNVTDPIELWLEDPANAGTLVLLGTLVPDDDEPELELDFDTSDGDLLPFGVAGVADLVGLKVELRSGADGSVLFDGILPPLNPS